MVNRFQKAMRRLLGVQPEKLDSYQSNWLYDMLIGRGESSAGVHVTPELSMQLVTVYSCVRLLSETIAQLPMQVYRRKANGSKEWLPGYPLQITLAREPNDWQTSFEFREMMMGHLSLRGNAYARIVPGVRGAVTKLIPLHPARMRPERLTNGRLRFEYTNPDGTKERYLQDELFRLCGLSSDGITGLNPVEMERDAIGGAKAIETYGNKFFANSARPGGFLTTDAPLKEDAAKQNRRMWEDTHKGSDNAHRTAVLTNGLKWQDVGMHNNDAQFLESQKYSDVKICRIFRIPPHLVYDLERATFSNIEEQSLEFAIYTMLPWVRRWEEAISRDLIVEPDIFVKFNMEGLLRGNAAARSAFYQQALTSGWMSINEVRELEDMNPIPNGDEHLIQGAMVPIERLLNPPEPAPLALPAPDETDDKEDMATVMIAALERNQAIYTDAIAKAHESTQLTVTAVQESMKAIQELAAMQLKEASEQHEALIGEHVAAVAERERLATSLEIASAERDSLQTDKNTLASELIALSQEVEAAHNSEDRLLETIGDATSKASSLLRERALYMAKVEATRIAEFGKNSKSFLDCIEKFYLEHERRFAEALELPAQIAESLTGNRVEFAAVVSAYLEESRRQLGSVYDTVTPEEFQDVILNAVAAWPQRAESDLSVLWTFQLEGGDEHAESNE